MSYIKLHYLPKSKQHDYLPTNYRDTIRKTTVTAFFYSCPIRKVAEVLTEVDDILSTDSYIRYANKRVHTAFFLLRVITALATNILQLLTDTCTSQLTC